MAFSPDCIHVIIVRKTEKGVFYLLLRRSEESLFGTWQAVTGGIDPQETAAAAALRELYEETGLSPVRFYYADFVETFYIPERDKFFSSPLFVAFVEQEEVSLSPSEHDAYEWVSLEEALSRLIWTEQRKAFSHVHEYFVLRNPNERLSLPLPTPS